MKNPLVLSMAIGAAVIAVAVAAFVFVTRGAHIELTGEVLKVRTAPLDEHSSVAVVDFRFLNPADYPFMVRSVTVILEDKAGKQTEGSTVAESDTQRLFDGVPLLGHKYNTTLIARDKIAPHTSQDRMVAARFEVPEDMLEGRKRLLVRVDEVDGAESDLAEKK